MKTAIVTIRNKREEDFLATFFKKTGIKARIVKHQEMEDAVFAALINKGIKTKDVSEEAVLKALDKNDCSVQGIFSKGCIQS